MMMEHNAFAGIHPVPRPSINSAGMYLITLNPAQWHTFHIKQEEITKVPIKVPKPSFTYTIDSRK